MRLVVVMSLGILAGCGPLGLYYKAGVPVAQMQSDLTDCKVTALGRVPVNKEIDIIPGPLVPASQICDGAGNCTIVPAHRMEGRVIVYDANEGLRADVTRQCMAKDGYVYTQVPACPAEMAQSVPARQTTVMPRLTPQSCAIRNQGGGWQIVNRG